MYRALPLCLIPLLFALTGCEQHGNDSGAAATSAPTPTPAAQNPNDQSAQDGAGTVPSSLTHALTPLPGKEDSAPKLTQATRVLMKTTAGDVTIEVYPQAAPNAAKRFIELVQNGFYDDTPISRVVPGFVAQFGVNWRKPYKSWRNKNFDDDPSYFALERGTLAFAKAGPNTNSTQVFINYAENNQLAAPQYNFTVFAKVVDGGMDVVDKFAQVGDPSNGLDQQRLWSDGDAYLASLAKKPTMIETAKVVGETGR